MKSKKKVLVVDSSSCRGERLSSTLKDLGYTVIDVCDKQNALHVLNRSNVDMLFTHNEPTPERTFSFLNEIRNLKGHIHTPIVVLTSHISRLSDTRGFTRVSAFLTTPIELSELKKVLGIQVASA